MKNYLNLSYMTMNTSYGMTKSCCWNLSYSLSYWRMMTYKMMMRNYKMMMMMSYFDLMSLMSYGN